MVESSLEQFANQLRRCAQEFHPKGAGYAFTHGVSRWRGSKDYEAVRLDWVWVDCDGKGEWFDLLRALDTCGVAYVASRSGGDEPGTPKWHIHLPLARALFPPAPAAWADPDAKVGPGAEAQKTHNESIIAWKAGYRDQCLWLFGVLSRLAQLPVSLDNGAVISRLDVALSSRLMQLSYPAARRKQNASPARIIHHDGRALDWFAVLEITGYAPTPNAIHRKAPSIDVDPERATAWHAALALDEYVIGEASDGKYVLRCPWEREHSTPGGTGTILFPSGKFHCSHEHCRRRTNADVLAILSPEARSYVEGANESAGVREVRDRLRNHTAARGERVSLQELATRIEPIVRDHKPGTTDVIVAPPGSGKNRAINKYLPHHPGGAVLVAPNHPLCEQHVFDIKGYTVGKVEHRRGVLYCKDSEDRPLCTQFARASAFQVAGADVSSAVCNSCPDKKGCRAIKAAREDRGASIIVTVPQLADKARKSVARLAGVDPREVLVIYDESVTFFEKVVVGQTELVNSLEVLDWDASKPEDERLFNAYKVEPLRALARVLVAQRAGLLNIDRACEFAPVPASLALRARGADRVPLPDALHHAVSQYVQDRIEFNGGLSKNTELIWAVDHGALSTVLRVVVALGHLAEAIDLEGVNAIEWQDGDLHVRMMTDAARDLERFGGVVTDATPRRHELEILARNVPATFHEFDVPDGAPILRQVVYRKETSKRALLGDAAMMKRGLPLKIAWDVTLGLFRDAILRAQGAGCRLVLFVLYKKLHDALELGIEPGALAVQQLLAEAGFGFDLAYHGKIRGMNTWLAFDACVTLGDPWEDIISSARDVRAMFVRAGLPVPPAEEIGRLQEACAEGELLQAHNRLRDPVRQAPAWHWHFGKLVPRGWTEVNATVDGAMLRGRPKASGGMTQDEVRQLVDARGGVEAAAKSLNCSERSVWNYLNGTRPLRKEGASS